MTTIDLFVKANAGVDIASAVPGLVERVASNPEAAPPLTLYAIQAPAHRDLVRSSLLAGGALTPRLDWYLTEGSVQLPWTTLRWETTFSAELRDGRLSWFEGNMVREQSITTFLAEGPPPSRSPPPAVLESLRAIVGGLAGDNRAGARERLLAKLAGTEVDAPCTRCAALATPRTADLRQGEALSAAVHPLLTLAERSFPKEELRRCLACGAHFHFENDWELGYTDTDSLRLISLEAAIAFVSEVDRPCFVLA